VQQAEDLEAGYMREDLDASVLQDLSIADTGVGACGSLPRLRGAGELSSAFVSLSKPLPGSGKRAEASGVQQAEESVADLMRSDASVLQDISLAERIFCDCGNLPRLRGAGELSSAFVSPSKPCDSGRQTDPGNTKDMETGFVCVDAHALEELYISQEEREVLPMVLGLLRAQLQSSLRHSVHDLPIALPEPEGLLCALEVRPDLSCVCPCVTSQHLTQAICNSH
jgi:hypothetical protein